MRIRLLLLTLCSSVLLAFSLPNEIMVWGTPWTGVLCLSGFLAAAAMAPTQRFASLLGAVFGSTSTLLSSFWLMFFQEFAVWTLGGVVLAYTGFGALLAGFLRGSSRMCRPAYRPFVLALVWTVYEYLKSVGFLGYPWGLIAYPVHGLLPLIQIADITGVWGVSLIMALTNAVGAEAIIRISTGTWRRRGNLPHLAAVVGVPALLVIAGLAYGTTRLTLERTRPPLPTVVMVLVQPNSNPWMPYDTDGILANQRLSEIALVDTRKQAGEVDLVVWSETSLDLDIRGRDAYYSRHPGPNPLLPYFRRTAAYHLIGSAIDVDPKNRQWMNGAVLVSPRGEVLDTYGKQHPVPFAESIPFWSSPVVRAFFTDVVGIHAPWVMGTRSTVFRVPTHDGGSVAFSVPICFEDAFSDLCRRFVAEGAQVLVNVTNDSWSRTVSALTQHFVAAKFRAVENRISLVRSTNGGITAVVGPSGRVLASLPPFASESLVFPVPVRDGALSAYTVWRDWLPVVLIVTLVGVLGWNVRRLRR